MRPVYYQLPWRNACYTVNIHACAAAMCLSAKAARHVHTPGAQSPLFFTRLLHYCSLNTPLFAFSTKPSGTRFACLTCCEVEQG